MINKEQVKMKFRAVGKCLSSFAKKNYLMLGYIIAAIFIELTGIAVTSGCFYMTEPWLYFSFIALPCFISIYMPGNRRRLALFITALAANFILDLVFIIIFDSTGTTFDYAMFNLRTDAMVIVESVPLSFTYIFVTAIVISVYCTLGVMLKKRMPEPTGGRIATITTSVLLAAVIGGDALLLYYDNYQNNANDLTYRLYRTETGTYSNKGLIGNFANELAKGWWFSKIDVGDTDELNEFIYRQTTDPTEKFGMAKGYNVVTVLCESFEWFTFLMDERYPNGFIKQLTGKKAMTREALKSALKTLYPNLYRLYESESTVILDNAYSLEKTDISENKAIIGNYPLYEYINYTYPTNTIPYSLPNILKTLDGTVSKSFHDGYRTFYNRNIHHTHALGFESFTPAEDMDFEDDDTGLGERNLDSEMMESCKTEMFPTDRRFNTFITTITQHGQYAYRENLKTYYDAMDRLGILPFDDGNDSDADDANALRYYCAAGMDFDKAIGIMLDYLDSTGLADKTLITIYGDHNCYYQGVSNYVKNIYSYDVKNYTELYRVPVMIKVGNNNMGGSTGSPVKPDGISRAYFVEKFTCVSDILPTILDLLGIKTFKNILYGVSAFDDDYSVLYSRAYDKFLTDKAYFNSLSHVIYKAPDTDMDIIEEKCLTLLDKISHVNRIFAGDFLKGDRKTEFESKLRALNPSDGGEVARL